MMKYLLTALLIFLSVIGAFTQINVNIGMTIEEVKNIYPNIKSDSNENGITLSRPETLYGLEGAWGYRFERGKLNWIFFDKYIKEINDTNFKKCLNTVRHLLKDYTGFYGTPDSTYLGDSNFIDPYKFKHWGYEVIEARWKNYDDMKIKLEFDFMGGKGVYGFLVKINFFDKDYPYFD